MKTIALSLIAFLLAPAASAELLSPKRILEVLPGRWAMETAEPGKEGTYDCNGYVIRIRIEVGAKTLTYVSKEEAKGAVEYRSAISAVSPNNDVNRPGAIVLQYEGETRLDARGKPVVWHLFMTDANTFWWHREDWPDGNTTAPSHRCPEPDLVS